MISNEEVVLRDRSGHGLRKKVLAAMMQCGFIAIKMSQWRFVLIKVWGAEGLTDMVGLRIDRIPG